MRRDDLGLVADLHLRELSHGFFPELGPRFLALYHQTFVDSPHCLATVAGRHAVHGFVTATLAPHEHARWVRTHALPRLLLAGVLALLTHPRALWTFVTTRAARYAAALWQRGRDRADGARSRRQQHRAPAVLHHLAVEPAARGLGLGAALTADVVAAARSRDADEVRLITERDGDAEGFYRAHGWEVLRHRRARDGSPVTELAIDTGTP